jgi:hypothetical protein
MSDRGNPPAPNRVRLVHVAEDLRLDRINDQRDVLTFRLPAPGTQQVKLMAVNDRAAKAVGRPAAREAAPFGVRPEPTLHDLAELHTEVVGHRALEAFDELAGDARLVRTCVVGVDDPDARARK